MPSGAAAWLRVGGEWQRLPDVLFALAEAIDKLKTAPGSDAGARMRALAELRELLEPARMAGKAEATGLIGAMTIAVADAFSLDLKGGGEQSLLVPILHHAGRDGVLLQPDQQSVFGDDQFNRFSSARSLYALGRDTYVVLTPVLRQALAEVRRLQSAPLAAKRAFLAAPRAFLREALGEETDATVLEALFLETPAYSDRVLGLGLWQRRVVPWIPLPSNDWFGADARGCRVPPAAWHHRGRATGAAVARTVRNLAKRHRGRDCGWPACRGTDRRRRNDHNTGHERHAIGVAQGRCVAGGLAYRDKRTGDRPGSGLDAAAGGPAGHSRMPANWV